MLSFTAHVLLSGLKHDIWHYFCLYGGTCIDAVVFGMPAFKSVMKWNALGVSGKCDSVDFFFFLGFACTFHIWKRWQNKYSCTPTGVKHKAPFIKRKQKYSQNKKQTKEANYIDKFNTNKRQMSPVMRCFILFTWRWRRRSGIIKRHNEMVWASIVNIKYSPYITQHLNITTIKAIEF